VLSAQSGPARPPFPTEPIVSCSTAVVPSGECFRRADLLVHRQHRNSRAPDYRYEGLAIGAIAGAVGGLVLSSVLCGLSDEAGHSCTGTVLLGTLGGAGLGSLAGLLIGGLFPKDENTTEVR
jgi:hypothetical protein